MSDSNNNDDQAEALQNGVPERARICTFFGVMSLTILGLFLLTGLPQVFCFSVLLLLFVLFIVVELLVRHKLFSGQVIRGTNPMFMVSSGSPEGISRRCPHMSLQMPCSGTMVLSGGRQSDLRVLPYPLIQAYTMSRSPFSSQRDSSTPSANRQSSRYPDDPPPYTSIVNIPSQPSEEDKPPSYESIMNVERV